MSSSSSSTKNIGVYKTPYLTGNLTQLKTLNNLQSVNSNNIKILNFVKVGLPKSLPKTTLPNPLLCKTFNY